MINVLDKLTIDQIAAGEVIERPLSVVKELVENSIDAGSTAITVEIREGGRKSIRVTDNGVGIEKDDIRKAFLRHATSKIVNASDLLNVTSLGFRGEALSSISAISKLEVITRTRASIIGLRYTVEGGNEGDVTEVGSPEGTTMIVRDIFYNTPARLKFLKSANSETNAISECVLHYTMSHPEIRFQFIADGKVKIKTSGDGTLRTNIYYNFGSDLTKALLPIDKSEGDLRIHGFIAKPSFTRGNRAYINYYVNGRFIKDKVIQAAILDGYRDYIMSHRYPFTALMLEIDPDRLDVNVHPTKKEVRFKDESSIYELIYHAIKEALDNITLIPEETLDKGASVSVEKKYDTLIKAPEPFEKKRADDEKEFIQQKVNYGSFSEDKSTYEADDIPVQNTVNEPSHITYEHSQDTSEQEQVSYSEKNIFREESLPAFRIIGQVFDTYWLIEYEDKMLIIDQHAAHEKVLYEKVVAKMKAKTPMSQTLLSPIVVSISAREREVLNENMQAFTDLGYELEDFGDTELLIRSVPADFLNLDPKEVLLDVLGSLLDNHIGKKPEMILDRLATMSCKAAVKGNNTLSELEAKTLIGQMLSLDEPYHCPHGRPTTISMSKYEFEKKFKRIL